MELTHVDKKGKARMVDVTGKEVTERLAVAKGKVIMRPETRRLILENQVKKGDVLGVAKVAGVMAAKKTAELIPLCHPLNVTSVDVDLEPTDQGPGIEITATVKITSRTGVEMEALTAVAVSALTIYDMCKAVDKEMTVTEVRLVKKTGGRSGTFIRP